MVYQKKQIEIGPFINWLQVQRIPKHRLSYLEYGNPRNKNVIVCAHGLTRNAHDFDKVASHLKDKFRVISISYPGRGNSDYFINKKHYNYQVYIKDSFIFLKKLGIQNPIWLGTSMGGLIGMAMASLKPKIFKGLILNDIGPSLRGNVLAKIRKYAAIDSSFENFEAAKSHLKVIYSQFGIHKEEDWDYMTEHSFNIEEDGKFYMNYDPEIVHGMQVNQAKPKDVNLWSVWNKIICPLMVVHGAKSDILDQTLIEKMKQTKNFHLHTVNYAGHAPALVTEDQIQAIKSWVEKYYE
jgi:pimeloyl-ACP methyl ester carboxylesterase